jgi:ring-1,2-phenylacetyl-CoA epoxidase subunit PaaE
MSIHFHKVRVKEVRKETADCVSVLLDIPAELQSTFAYREGQNITIKTNVNGEEVRRSYSLCTSPAEKEWRVAVKAVPNGSFSQYANTQLKAGDELEVLPPTGSFNVPLAAGNRKNYVAVAAGSGITPIISIIKTILQTEPQSQVTLVYGNRDRNSIIFREALEALKNTYMQNFRIVHVLSREVTDATINTGRIDAAKCDQLFNGYLDLTADAFFLCGPADMIFCVRDYLAAKGVSGQKIHFELFTTPATANKDAAPRPKPLEGKNAKSQVTVKIDGNAFSFELGFNEKNILDAALKQGADLPYACKGGVCSTCRAKVLEGEVSMDENYALEADEIVEGYVLTCQAHPKTDRVVIDFDA